MKTKLRSVSNNRLSVLPWTDLYLKSHTLKVKYRLKEGMVTSQRREARAVQLLLLGRIATLGAPSAQMNPTPSAPTPTVTDAHLADQTTRAPRAGYSDLYIPSPNSAWHM